MDKHTSDENLFIQDCHTIFNIKAEDIKGLKDKLLSDKIKTTALYDMILEGDINFKKISISSEIDLPFTSPDSDTYEFAYSAGYNQIVKKKNL